MAEDRELRRLLECSSHGIGDEEYVETLETELRERKSGLDRDRDVSYPVERISLDRIDAVVAGEFGVEVVGLSAHGRCKGVGEAKMAGIELACRLSGMSQREIGEHYGGMSSQAVSKSRKRAKLMIPPDTVTRLAKRIREPSHVS
jgi:chromosomal replication initiation ATPase DnaA